MLVCGSCGERNPDRARFCSNCAQPLETAEASPYVRKTVTVLFCDVTGSTASASGSTRSRCARVMRRYFDEMRDVLERHGGTVEKFIGDAVMAVFGVPRRARGRRAARGARGRGDARARCGALNDELERRWGVRLEVRIGHQHRRGRRRRPGGGRHARRPATRSTSPRGCEQAAAPGEILIGTETYRLVRDAVDGRAVEACSLKGKSEPVVAWRLDRVDAGRARPISQLDAPLVGRERELRACCRRRSRTTVERARAAGS